MRIQYGFYQHALYEAGIAVQKRPLMTEYGYQFGVAETWTINGVLVANSQAELIVACNALELAYSVNNLGIALLTDGGDVARVMTGITAIGGTRVLGGVDFPDDGSRSAEFTTFRHYRITVEGRYPNPAATTAVTLAYSESLEFMGGGPRFIYLQPINGLPQKQTVAASTPYRVTQKGQGVGLSAWPIPPLPIWPAAEHRDRRRIVPGTPKREGGGLSLVYTEFPIEWSYEFESELPLTGAPTLWVSQ